MSPRNITLAIETGVGRGSLALFDHGNLIDSRSGGFGISRSEDLLNVISDLLEANIIDRTEISTIAIANDCGSRTGLRIGLATAIGLSSSLSCSVLPVPVLSAMFERAKDQKTVVCAVASGDRHIYSKIINPDIPLSSSDPIISDLGGFRDQLDLVCPDLLIVNDFLYGRIVAAAYPIENVGENLAEVVGIFAHRKPESANSKDVFRYI